MPNIKLKGQTGEVLTYEDVERVYFDSADQEGEVVYYTHGQAVSKAVTPNFASGDMNVPIADGELVTELTIKKPNTLTEENIRYGKTVAGVQGKFLGDTEEVTVDLDMAEGGQVITPTVEGKAMSKVVVTKPGTMVPGNIRAGIDIGGVVGEYVTPGTTKKIEPYFRDCLVIDNPEYVSALLSDRGNIGKYVKYTGETGDYISGQFYKVIDEYENAKHCPSVATEVTSDTVLTATLEGCKVGDLVVAAFVIRSDLVSLSDGWALISTSQSTTEIDSSETNNQTLSFAYKYATSTTEEITVTQTTAARIYINMVSLSDVSEFTDAGYQYQSECPGNSVIFVRPEGNLVLWGATKPRLSAGGWTVSNNSRLIQLDTAARLLLAIDVSNEESVTFGFQASNFSAEVCICGALSIELEPATHLVEVESTEVPIADAQTVTAGEDELWNEVVVKMPETLIPENIAKDVEIGGVVGSFTVEGSTKEIEPDFSAGDQAVTAGEDELWDEVILKMPETLLAGNIVKGVNIAGVTGTFESPKIVVKRISGSEATEGILTLFTADELASIGFADASSKFALLIQAVSTTPTVSSWNKLAMNYIRYPYNVYRGTTSAPLYGYYSYHNRNGTVSYMVQPTLISSNPWNGTELLNTMFYADGELRYSMASTYGRLSLSSTSASPYYVIAGCY